jgi:putative iron-only hydrogenase system regulator
MKKKKYLATLSILVKDRQNHANEVNKLLTENGHMVIARLGVNLSRACVENCMALIVVAVEAHNDEIKSLTKKINSLYGIAAKVNIIND